MKSIILFLLAAVTTVNTFGQGIFSNVTVQDADRSTTLSFTADKNVNVRHYRIEASNDNKSFTVIGRVDAKTNSMRPTDYNYDLSGHDYNYYRVAKVGMDGTMPYSDVVSMQKNTTPKMNNYELPNVNTAGDILAEK